MNIIDIRKEKKQILADIKALRERHARLLKREREIKRHRIELGHCCNYTGCYNLTSRKTSLAKLGEYYKQCDEHRLQRKIRYISLGN